MRIFITGATGFIGTEFMKELIAVGHQVRGLARSEAGGEQLRKMGAEVHRGDLRDLDSLRSGARGMDAVVNLAFNHDFSTFAQSSGDEISAIEALGSALEPGKLLVVTSGIGITAGAPGRPRLESDPPTDSKAVPRRPEQAALAVAARGVRVAVVRLPQVHDTRKQGLVTRYIEIAREKRAAAYIGEGRSRWSAAHVLDVALLYRLAVEQGQAGERFHAVGEEGVSARDIATAVGAGLGVPVVSVPPEQAAEQFGWLGAFAAMDLPASNTWTCERLGWRPEGPGLIADLQQMEY